MKLGLIGILGEELDRNFWGSMTRLAEIGYQGIEGAEGHILAGDLEANLARLEGIGIKNLTTSAGREDLRDRLDDVRAKALATKTDRVSVWWSEANDREALLRDAELYDQAGKSLYADGIRLCYHNHDHEYRNLIDGVSGIDFLAANTDPKSLYFTIDVGWVGVGGADYDAVLRGLPGRVPTIHVKDFVSFDDRDSFTTVGTGALDLPGILATARDCGVEWAVVEQDRLRSLTAWETVTAAGLHLRERGVG